MKLVDIVNLINGNILCGNENINCEIEKAFASDLMSDVLTIPTENIILITGLANLQTIRTAEMADINYILLVRNKKATKEMILLAKETQLVLIESPYSMFRVCGILSNNGLKPVF